MLQPRNKSTLIAKWLAVVSFFVIVSYPIIVGPMVDPTKYKEFQKDARKGINQEDIQPGNMKIWSDPFQRK